MTIPSENLGVGLDIGTMNFVASRVNPSGGLSKRKQITDAYIELEVDNVKTLRLSNIPYVEFEEVLVVTGEKSFQMANLFKQEVKRPLSKGLISPDALRAQRVLKYLVSSVLDEPLETGEHCFYSVPADPIDLPGQNVVFHTELFRRLISKRGYTAHPVNEAMAIIYSECESSTYSGLAMSFGAGLCNVALSYNTLMGLNFSISKGGGDWIDANAAQATGSTVARMCVIKERGGFNLSKPSSDNPEVEAISVYVRTLIRHCLKVTAAKIKKEQSDSRLLEPIPLIVSGGTTLADGFLELFKEEFEELKKRGFPIPISEIRRAVDPLNAVADGLLVLAKNEYA